MTNPTQITLKGGIYHKALECLREAKDRKTLLLWDRLEPGTREPPRVALSLPFPLACLFLHIFFARAQQVSFLCNLAHVAKCNSQVSELS